MIINNYWVEEARGASQQNRLTLVGLIFNNLQEVQARRTIAVGQKEKKGYGSLEHKYKQWGKPTCLLYADTVHSF